MALLPLARGLLDLLAPPRCPACDDPLTPDDDDFCGACAPLLEPIVGAREGGEAAYRFQGPMADAIRRFKYVPAAALAGPLGRRMAEAAAVHYAGRVDLVVPVPLHPERLRQRGFNQSALLARPASRILGASLSSLALRRRRPTPPQAGLSRGERARNVRGAFSVRRPRAVAGRRVLVVDDVRTSGATLAEAVAELRRAGAAEVHAFVLAAVDGTLPETS
ncbi:MAG: ComF family protein [Sandaracinaceae bacterium]